MRAKLAAALDEASKTQDETRLGMLRLINAAIRDRLSSLAVADEEAEPLDDAAADEEIIDLLGTMIEQREESAREYEEGGRLELAQRERREIAVVREFLPRKMTDAEMVDAVAEAIASVRADGIRDISKVMAELKRRHAGRMDFCAAGARVRDALCRHAKAPAET